MKEILNILQLDEPLSEKELLKNARCADGINEKIQIIMEERFGLNQSEDFYKGMATAMNLILEANKTASYENLMDFCYLILYSSSYIAMTKKEN